MKIKDLIALLACQYTMCTLRRTNRPRADFECGNQSSEKALEQLFAYIHSVYADVSLKYLPVLHDDGKYKFTIIGYGLGKTELEIEVYNQQ